MADDNDQTNRVVLAPGALTEGETIHLTAEGKLNLDEPATQAIIAALEPEVITTENRNGVDGLHIGPQAYRHPIGGGDVQHYIWRAVANGEYVKMITTSEQLRLYSWPVANGHVIGVELRDEGGQVHAREVRRG